MPLMHDYADYFGQATLIRALLRAILRAFSLMPYAAMLQYYEYFSR